MTRRGRARSGIASALIALAATAPALAQTDAAALERGRYLVEGIGACGHCHTPQALVDGRQVELPGLHLAGGYGFDNPVLGRWAGANITPDAETGIGGWSAAQVAAAIREGRRPDGSRIGPPMPFAHYRQITEADGLAMAAYLLSLPPVPHAVERSSLRIPVPTALPPAPPARAAEGAAAPGAYLADLGHCMDCHTPNRAEGGGRDWTRLGAGGRPVMGLAGPVIAPNITPHPTRGIGRWTDQQIARAITDGVSADGRRLMPPMPFAHYARVTDADLADLVAYLRSLPAQP